LYPPAGGRYKPDGADGLPQATFPLGLRRAGRRHRIPLAAIVCLRLT